ncbi:TRAP transporter permease DctQ [Comamonas serinivorans]|uniref:TRAP transporter small permease protein n=1 Tax=Comamonas serinivorans TaxID=1082851 RepID=A0A1Y0EKG5_9BURK|nr:TRAP transporter small permease [Comamonas serinivorans]ARU04135.1 TRAP transporter permease DctQ [Comamonas serinivorans]
MSSPELPDPDEARPDAGSPPDVNTRVPLKIEDWLTVLIMAALALITFANVLVRYFTSVSFAWTEEFSVFLMIVLAMVAGSAAFARNAHIRIEYFAERGSSSRQRAFARVATALVVVFFALLTVLSARVLLDDIEFGETSPGIGVPVWWYTMWMPICAFAITLRALGLYIRQSRPDPGTPVNKDPA